MMFGGERDANATNIFKWTRHDSSLTSPLLNVVPPEIELSDYRRAPSPGSESPSRFLDDERLNTEPIADLDLFFERIYNYYCEKGLWCIIIKWIIELLSLIFIICFSAFFLLYVDWNGLRHAKCGMDAVESGTKPCDLSKEALHQYPLTPFTITKTIIVGYLGIFSIYLLFCFLRFFAQLKATLSVRQFYYDSLHVTDKEIQTMQWELILEKVVQLQNSQQLCVVKDLSIHDVVMRLMRKENYMIGMLNKGVLAFPIFWWVPGAGPTITCGPNGTRQRLILPKTLEWTLNWCILQSMFDRNFCIRREFLSDPDALRKRLMIVGFLMLLLSPFLIIFMLVYLFLKYAEQFYNQPSTASSRRWSNLAKWMFREFNEVDHLFKHRINSSLVHSSNYIKQFPSPILSVIAKFISFVSGGLAAVLIIVAFLDESLLEGHIFGRNLFWYAAVFGTITAISRAAVTEELLVLDPQGTMSLVVQHTHYMPKRWRGKENCDTVRVEFETLFQYTVMLLLEEMASIFLTPYLLLFVVPKRVDDILQFIADFTLEVEGVGHVCSFSMFDFQHHGNSKYGSPFDTPRILRSSQGKMEKSFLSFQSSYPLWEPNAQGKQFLATLQTFGEQKLQGQLMGPAGLPSRVQHWSPNSGVGERCTFCTRKMPFSSLGTGYQLNLMVNGELNNYPYILDYYYTSQPHHDSRDDPSRLPDPSRLLDHREDQDQDRDRDRDRDRHKQFWIPSGVRENEAMNDENWGYLSENRSQGDLGASTSAPLFQESILQHQEESSNVVNPTRSDWWDRNNRQGTAAAQTSFLEPPNFVRGPSLDHYNNLESSTSSRALHNLESSTPTHMLQHTVIQVHDSSDTTEPTGSNWWGRRESTTPAPATSFLQPPDFSRSNLSPNYHDNISERSMEEEDDQLDWRNSSNRLSRTFYMDDIEGGEMNLPFDDIYQKDSKDPSPSSSTWPEDPSNLV